MSEADTPRDREAIVTRLRAQAAADQVRVTQHAQQEMIADRVTLDDVFEVIATAQVLENYAEHQRGACCLLYGVTRAGRPLHVVCTTMQPLLIIITVYEPTPPRWLTPTTRRPPP